MHLLVLFQWNGLPLHRQLGLEGKWHSRGSARVLISITNYLQSWQRKSIMVTDLLQIPFSAAEVARPQADLCLFLSASSLIPPTPTFHWGGTNKLRFCSLLWKQTTLNRPIKSGLVRHLQYKAAIWQLPNSHSGPCTATNPSSAVIRRW